MCYNFNIEEYGGKRELEFHLNILKWCVDKILYADLEKYPEVKHYTETYFKSFIIFPELDASTPYFFIISSVIFI